MSRFVNPFSQFSVQAGLLSGGKLNFYITNTTAEEGNRKDTFSDVGLTIANANPVILGDNGEIPPIFLAEDVAYFVVETDADNVQIDTADPVGVTAETGAFALWSSTVTYDIPDLVTGSDKNYYRSITDSNLNNDPTSSAANWSQVDLNTFYNVNETYAADDIVWHLGLEYRSRVGSNVGNAPASSPTQWANMTGIGKQTIFVPAAGAITRTTNGAPAGTVETSTNEVMIETKDFDTATDEFVQFFVQMPENWDAGTVVAQFIWSHAATTVNFGVAWAAQGLALVNDDAIDTAFGTAIVTTDTGGTTDDLFITANSAAITISNTPAKSDWVVFQVFRDVSDAGDTLAIDARLHGLRIVYTTTSSTDN